MSQDQRLLSHERFNFLHSFWFKLLMITVSLVLVAVLVNWGIHRTVTRQTVTTELQEKGYIIAKFVRSFKIPT